MRPLEEFNVSLQYLFLINTFLANVPILYPLKTPENLWYSGFF